MLNESFWHVHFTLKMATIQSKTKQNKTKNTFTIAQAALICALNELGILWSFGQSSSFVLDFDLNVFLSKKKTINIK